MDIITRATKHPELFGLDIRVEWSQNAFSVVVWADIFHRENQEDRLWMMDSR
jgi:hypothetical protein